MKYIFKITIVFILTTISVYSQSKYLADKYFSEFAYVESAEAYKSLYSKGEHSYDIISKLADSYYFNTKIQKSEKWYSILYEKYPESIETEHLFRYAQSLKGIKNYKRADKIMEVIGAIDSYDSRSEKLKANPTYVSDFSSPVLDILSFDNLDINTKYSDFGGFIYRGKLYYASAKPAKIGRKKYKWNNQPFLNLYEGVLFSNKDKGFQIKKTELMKTPLNTKYHDASAIITKSGKIMYFTRDNHNNGFTASNKEGRVMLKLYRASLVNGVWDDITELPFNNDEYSVGHPALSPDEKTLYFVSNMPGGYGATDIYKVEILEGGRYTEPVNLGDKVNTEGREMFPYVGLDDMLYFSSDGHLGLGGLDIFESQIINESDDLGEVKNLGVPFNSPLDDFSFFIDKKNIKGVLSSNRDGGKGDDDIYSFVLKSPKVYSTVFTGSNGVKIQSNNLENTECKQVLTGIVSDIKSGRIIPDATINLIDFEGKVVASTLSNKDGLYDFKVSCSESYRLLAFKSNYRKDLKVLNTSNINRNSNLLNLDLLPLIQRGRIAIHPIYFDFDKSNIRLDSQYELENVVRVMRDNPHMKIKIESHTDSRGSDAYNKKLSQDRADSTRSYIISRGIAAYRIISAIGYGEEHLLNNCSNNSNCSDEEHQRNRRSYFIIAEGNKGNVINETQSDLSSTMGQSKQRNSSHVRYHSSVKKLYHIVKKGQTIYSISIKNNLTINRLKEINNLKTNIIYPGQKLRLF